MKYRLVIALVLAIGGCDGAQIRQDARMQHFEVRDGDFRQIAIAAFGLIDPKSSIIIIVVPADIEPRARAGLKAVANVVNADQVPSDGTLPAGYFRVRTFSIEDGVAQIEGQLGPVTNAVTAAGLRDCGKIFTIPFQLQGGDWVGRSYKVETCAESRNWVPVDSVPRE